MVALEEVIEVALTAEMTGGTAALLTVTETLPLVAVFPAASLATAASVCVPLAAVAVFQETLYEGPAPLTTLPRFAPSSLNWTPVTPTLSVAFAVTVTPVPLTVAPFAGAVIDTDGGIVSLFTVTETLPLVAVFPAA